MSVKIEDTRQIYPELNIPERIDTFSRPVVDLTESHSENESEQVPGKFIEDDPQTATPIHATAVRLTEPFLQRPQTEPSSLGFSLPPVRGEAETSNKTAVPFSGPFIESSQVESTQVTESQVRGWLGGNWELAGELLNAQLSQDLKVSPHHASSKNRSLLQTSSPSAAEDRLATSFQWNGFCSPRQPEMEQADSASLRITGQPKRTPHSGHARPGANSEWQPVKAQADDPSNPSDPPRCDTAVQPQLSASDIKDTDHRSSSHESDVDLEDPSCFFWQDASYDEQNNEESRFESDPRSASPDDAAFVCPAALSKLMSGQAQSLGREVSGFILL